MNKLNKAIQKIANKYNCNAGLMFNNIPEQWGKEKEIMVSFGSGEFFKFSIRVSKWEQHDEKEKITADLIGQSNTIIPMDDLPEIQALTELIKEEL